MDVVCIGYRDTMPNITWLRCFNTSVSIVYASEIYMESPVHDDAVTHNQYLPLSI
jgi:hypothetical protein